MTRRDLPEQQAFPTRSASIPLRATASSRDLEARRTAAQQARIATITTAAASASPQCAGFHAGLHPEDAPSTSTAEVRPRAQQQPAPIRFDADDLDDDVLEDDLPLRRPRTSARRYYTSPPATTALPERTRVLPRHPHRQFSVHWLLLVGVMLCVMLLGWVSLSALGGWWQTRQDDWRYGRPRTFQVDAVVGQNGDSPAHPSHFIAMNLHRQVVVIEIPAGDPSKMQIYLGPVLLGDGQDLTPVTLSFEDRNGDGKPDLNIHIGDQVVVFLNTGQKFVTA